MAVVGLYSSAFSFTLDKKYPTNNSLFYSSHYEVPYVLGYSLALYSLLWGVDNNSESRFQRASSKAIETLVINQIATEAIKLTAGRKRPRNTSFPSDWGYFGNKSFPSGHVSSTTAIITPYILEYKDDYPAIYLLGLLPLHQMLGRVNAQAHWTSDVLAGALLGGGIAFARHKAQTNLLVQWTKEKKWIGVRSIF